MTVVAFKNSWSDLIRTKKNDDLERQSRCWQEKSLEKFCTNQHCARGWLKLWPGPPSFVISPFRYDLLKKKSLPRNA
ncbi:hypothetical protein OUZ56_008576 [Daphnia magna]|uniref:Uncharacterized protein n=1 Tax=Daphnia magna TaxID=35525 RepID=A0ABR0ADF0_9CRUS|nr:hypothetical protein OUZ56_008576 [Daphnia magna]